MTIGSHSHAWSHSTHRCVHCGIYAAGTSQDGNHSEDHQHPEYVTPTDPTPRARTGALAEDLLTQGAVTINEEDLVWLLKHTLAGVGHLDLGETEAAVDNRVREIAAKSGIWLSKGEENIGGPVPMSKVYIVMEIGCTECSHPSELLLVTTDIDEAKAAWHRRMSQMSTSYQPPFERQTDSDEEWPANAVAYYAEGSWAFAVYEYDLDDWLKVGK